LECNGELQDALRDYQAANDILRINNNNSVLKFIKDINNQIKTPDWKKAIITLKEGSEIKLT